MPQMADITVKKADGTTNIVYSALTPSAGDSVAAQWRSETAGTAAGLRPTLSLSSKWNGPRTARVLNGHYVYPEVVTDTTTSTSRVRNRIPIALTATIPAEIPQTIVDEAISQATNAFASVLFVASLKSGFAPT